MFETLRKSRLLTVIALDRLSDYLALLRIEMKIQGRELGARAAGYAVAALCAMFTLLFVGIAIIVSFWDSAYRVLAAWVVVALYACGVYAGQWIAHRHSSKTTVLGTLREEIRRDAALLRESL